MSKLPKAPEHEHILNIQLDLIDNDIGLEFTRKRGKDNE
jgi:hypothetical protein